MEWETEARRLAERTEGHPDAIHQGLVEFVSGGGSQPAGPSDDLRLLANRAATRYRATWDCSVGYRGHYYWLDALQSEVADMVGPVPDAEEVGEIFLNAWHARVTQQRHWPETTDNDRLSHAFTALNSDGIVAREDFACCQRCARSEIFGEFPGSSLPSGFVFFHQQDMLRAAVGDAWWLGFGGFTKRDFQRPPGSECGTPPQVTTTTSRAERAVAALQAEGLHVTWDHATTQRIAVTLDWKRRIQPH